MLTITDAEHLQTVAISIELAQSVGVFKDMIDSVGQGGQSEPVPPRPLAALTIRLFWMNLPRFSTYLSPGYFIAQSSVSQQVTLLIAKLTTDNLAKLLELSHKYEIPSLVKDIGVIPSTYGF